MNENLKLSGNMVIDTSRIRYADLGAQINGNDGVLIVWNDGADDVTFTGDNASEACAIIMASATRVSNA